MKVMAIVGTRPDTIKLAPVYFELKSRPNLSTFLCATGQHMEMLEQALDIFDIIPDVNLKIMSKNQTLESLSSKLISEISKILKTYNPDIVLVHGDTTTAFCGALAAFYGEIPVIHIEAGLRTSNIHEPFPEEFNRQAIARLADFNFAPTSKAKTNLLNEGINVDKIEVSGNTVVEALSIMKKRIDEDSTVAEKVLMRLNKILGFNYLNENFVLITLHRRENFGSGIINICNAILDLSTKFSSIKFILPVHLNPSVSTDIYQLLSGRANVFLINPLSYIDFVALMSRAALIITDSGGIQEEAVSLGKYTLVTRHSTEREEGVESGLLEVVATDRKKIVERATSFLLSPKLSQIPEINPFGSGKISKLIVDDLVSRYGSIVKTS
jgi:UDP-N-acetylglucosamine 2-epimerase (non-hydrolysing)